MTDFGVGIALEQHPFEHGDFVRRVEDDIGVFFNENAGLRRALAEQGINDPLIAVRAEFPHVAGFSFHWFAVGQI